MTILYKIKLLPDGSYSVQRRNPLTGRWIHRNKFADFRSAEIWAEAHLGHL